MFMSVEFSSATLFNVFFLLLVSWSVVPRIHLLFGINGWEITITDSDHFILILKNFILYYLRGNQLFTPHQTKSVFCSSNGNSEWCGGLDVRLITTFGGDNISYQPSAGYKETLSFREDSNYKTVSGQHRPYTFRKWTSITQDEYWHQHVFQQHVCDLIKTQLQPLVDWVD